MPSVVKKSKRTETDTFLFFRLELTAYFHQIDSIGDNVLGFLYHCQINHADFDAAGLALDTLQFFTFQM